MRKQAYWRELIGALFFFMLVPWAAKAEIDPATVQKLLAGDKAAGDLFGRSVVVSGNTAIIGTPLDDDRGADSGSAYVFVRAADGTWTQQAKLTADDGVAGDRLGMSVAMFEDTVIIGADNNGGGDGSGSAYIFVRATDGTWTQQAKLLAEDGAAGDLFGYSVAISGDTAIIGAFYDDDKYADSGSAYVFVRAADGSWTQQAKLLAEDRAAGDRFGMSVALSGDTAIIGACWDDDKGPSTGSAYIFVRAADGTWIQQTKLLADDSTADDWFGRSVAISGDTVIIGAPFDNDKGTDSGSAYIFVRAVDGTWIQQDKLLVADGAARDRFGVCVALSGDIAIIGAYWDDDKGVDSGSAYIFIRTMDGSWTQVAKLLADDGAAGDWFGHNVSIDGDIVMIGPAWADPDGLSNAGAVYIFGGTPNNVPVADAGSNQSVIQGEEVCFDGSGSTDADGDLLSYLWTLTAWPAGSAAVLDNPTVDKPCFTADLPGTYQVSLTVNDGTVDSAPSTAEAVAISCQDVAREAVNAVNALDPSVFGNKNNKNNQKNLKNLTNGILEVIALVDQQLYAEALLKLEGGSVLGKTKGCATVGAPDNDDWIKDCASQAKVYPLLQQTMVCVQSMI